MSVLQLPKPDSDSNDTGITTHYELGFFGSATNSVGAKLRNDSNTTSFLYGPNSTTSKIANDFSRSVVYLSLEFIRFGLDLQSSHIVVNQYGVNYIDLLGTGYGGNVGFYVSDWQTS